MATYGTMQMPSTTSTSTLPTTTHPHEPKDTTRKTRNDFKLLFPFNIPATPEAAGVRIIRNLSYFQLYYILFIWSILFITLLPKRKVSLIFLVAMTAVTCLYLVVLRILPNSAVTYKSIDTRLVLALLAIVTMVELILTRAAIHLFLTLGCGTPVVLVHAFFRVRDDLFVEDEVCASGELVPLRTTSDPKLSDSV